MKKNSGIASELGAKFGKAAVSREPEAALSTFFDVISFHQTVGRFHPKKFAERNL